MPKKRSILSQVRNPKTRGNRMIHSFKNKSSGGGYGHKADYKRGKK